MSIAVIINNYLHDVASAMLLASALVVWLAGRRITRGASPAAFIAGRGGVRRVVAVIAAVALTVALGACAGVPAAQTHPAARAVVALLNARAARSTDPKAYQPYVSESAIATELASAAFESASGTPIPRWRAPYVSSLTTSTADVVVVWVPSKAFSGWPAATDFKMERYGGGWVVVDAVTLEEGDIQRPLAMVGDTPAR